MIRSALLVVSLLAAGAPAEKPKAKLAPEPAAGFVEMEVKGVYPQGESNAAILTPKNGEAVLVPIFIGDAEATAIRMRLSRQSAPRPMTHDLLENVIRALGARVVKVEIDDLKQSVYLGRVYLMQGEKSIQLDARPSDSMALALGTGAPIHCAAKVIEAAGVRPDAKPAPVPDDKSL